MTTQNADNLAHKIFDEARDLSHKTTALAKALIVAGDMMEEAEGFVDFGASDIVSLGSLAASKSHEITQLFDSGLEAREAATNAAGLASQLVVLATIIDDGITMGPGASEGKIIAGLLQVFAEKELAIFERVLDLPTKVAA